MTMSMLQTSLTTADSAIRFNMPHTRIMWLRHLLQEIGTTWNHPRSGLLPGTTPSKDWHSRLRHLWDQWRPSTRTVAETPGRHDARISTQTMRNHPRWFTFTLGEKRPYRGPILNRQWCAARFHWVTVQRISFSALHRTALDQMHSKHCPGQRTQRPVPHRAWARDLIHCQIRSRDPTPETMVQLCLVI